MLESMSINLLFKAVVIIILVSISIIDIYKFYIPNSLNLSLILIGIFYNFFFRDNLVNSILGVGLYSVPFSLIYGYISDFLNKEVLGYGDIKLAMGIGAVLGYTSLLQAYLFFLYSFLIGAIYAVYLLMKNKEKNVEMPFGPFISLSGIILLCL